MINCGNLKEIDGRSNFKIFCIIYHKAVPCRNTLDSNLEWK